jgi:CheY-like chemotaxis protein
VRRRAGRSLARDLERKLWRAAPPDEIRDLVPVDQICEVICQRSGQAEVLQLFGAPLVDKKILIAFVVVLTDGYQHRPHLSVLLHSLAVLVVAQIFARARPRVIEATCDLSAWAAALLGFLLPAMRRPFALATLVSVALRVLIVDDNPSFLDAAGALLTREGQCVVGVASTTAEALRRAKELTPDVVLVDITLGPESGFELARRLAEQDGESWPLVILISTHDREDFADLIAESPAAGFVPKSELSAEAIRRLVNGSSR